MMKSQIKEWMFDGVDDIEKYHPDDAAPFGILVTLLIGPADVEGEESFQVVVCNPEWIRTMYASNAALWGRHFLIVLRYDWRVIRGMLVTAFDGVEGRDWKEIGERMSAFGLWEFEGLED